MENRQHDAERSSLLPSVNPKQSVFFCMKLIITKHSMPDRINTHCKTSDCGYDLWYVDLYIWDDYNCIGLRNICWFKRPEVFN